MKQNIEQILQELYAIDSGLKANESELRRIIHAFMANRPNISMDPLFQSELRKHITDRIASIQGAQRMQPIKRLFNMKKFNFSLGTAVIGLVLAVPVLYYANERGVFNQQEQNTFSPEIKSVGRQAFGNLNAEGSAGGRGGGGDSTAYRSQSGGGGSESADMKLSAPSGSPISPEFSIYKYVYKGEPIELQDETVSVLRRVKGSDVLGSLGSLLDRLDLDSIDLSSFKNLKVNTLNLQEEGENGFGIYIDLNEGMISINRIRAYAETAIYCKGPNCSERPPLKSSDIPADETIIQIAKEFMLDHGIDPDAYGAPEILDDWRIYYERATPAKRLQIYVPEIINVVFPLVFNGQKTYEEGGQVAGLSVQVDVRDKQGMGFYNLTAQRYESSDYKAITDSNKILEAVGRGTFRAWGQGQYPPDQQPTVKEVEVGTPLKGYVHIWNYVNNQSEELYVPALLFPITKFPDQQYFYQKYIVIPLAEDLLKNSDGGPIKILSEPRG